MRSSKAPSELAAAAAANTAAAANLLLRKHQIASIFQHYYPEGHWGYVVLLCAFLVQVLRKSVTATLLGTAKKCHGNQMALYCVALTGVTLTD